MIQHYAFETTDYPMADAWEAAEKTTEEAPRGGSIGKLPRPVPSPPKQNCLQCGRKSDGMFCTATCRAKFIAAGERYAARLARTRCATDTVIMF